MHRVAILANHRFRTKIQRTIWEVYSGGVSMREVARVTGRRLATVQEAIASVRLQYAEQRAMPDDQVAELLRECDRTTVVLFFALLKRAVEQPEEMRAAMERLAQRAALRALLEVG